MKAIEQKFLARQDRYIGKRKGNTGGGFKNGDGENVKSRG